MVWPDTEPKNLDRILEENGFKSAEVSEGMTLETKKHHSISVPKGLEARKISYEDIHQYVEVVAAGWDSREIDKANAVDRIKREFERGDFFWVFEKGEPIATGETQYVSLSGYLSGSSVIPKFRGRGAYRLLLKKRLQEMEKKGVRIASTIALVGTSAPVLKKIGFGDPIPIRYYSWAESKEGDNKWT